MGLIIITIDNSDNSLHDHQHHDPHNGQGPGLLIPDPAEEKDGKAYEKTYWQVIMMMMVMIVMEMMVMMVMMMFIIIINMTTRCTSR